MHNIRKFYSKIVKWRNKVWNVRHHLLEHFVTDLKWDHLSHNIVLNEEKNLNLIFNFNEVHIYT